MQPVVRGGRAGTQDWAEMLMRMYMRWAEATDSRSRTKTRRPVRRQGLSSAEFVVKGRYAYGWLKAERVACTASCA